MFLVKKMKAIDINHSVSGKVVSIQSVSPKPFLKWAGGKTQLLPYIDGIISSYFHGREFVYIEPFVGSGALLFWVVGKYKPKRVVINDINSDLINVYEVVKNDVENLILILREFEEQYHKLEGEPDKKKEFYYSKRQLFNRRNSDKITQAALFIFLNKTCYNGLYRVNRNNEFNVPIGRYSKPKICDELNLLNASRALKDVIILNNDFEKTLEYACNETLFYFDPPYRPLSKTSNFNSYSYNEFDDYQQKRLAKFCERIDSLGYKWILSNSDPKNINADDDFFDTLYSNFHIKRIRAKRFINSKAIKEAKLMSF